MQHTKSLGLKKKVFMRIALSVVIIALIATSVILFLKYDDLKRNPNQAVQAETSSLTTKVAKLMALPANETPTMATVEDINKLKNQPFFSEAKNGDKLLIYTTAKKAIIYRESDNRIINVGPIAINSDGTTDAKNSDKKD